MADITAELKLTNWNASQLQLRIPIIMNKYSDTIWSQFKEEIKAVQYPWPNETVRRGRYNKAKTDRQRKKVLKEQGGLPYTIAGSPRDIVDSRTFLNSQRRKTTSNSRETMITFTWDPVSEDGFHYAKSILEGFNYVTKSGRAVKRPGRNWIKPALEKHPLDEFFVREWRRLSKSGRL